jgi:hypothetical protein
MEDFGYKKTNEPEKKPLLMKKIFLVSATLLSLSAFIYITINAYYFINKNDAKKEIETIKGPESAIKIYEGGEYDDKENKIVDHSIYDDIFGNRKDILKEEIKINKSQEPAYPSSIAKDSNNQKIIKENIDDSENLVKKIDELSNQKIEKPIIEKPVLDATKSNKNVAVVEEPVKIAPKPRKRSAIRVQISAMSSRENCEEHWNKLSKLYPEVFSRTKYFIEEVDLGRRGIFFRLQIGEFFNQIDAEEFCSRFVAKAQKTRSDCIVVE